MGATTYLVPALTVLMSWAILGQIPSWLALAGGMLCLAGVALSRRRPGTPQRGRAVVKLPGPAGTGQVVCVENHKTPAPRATRHTTLDQDHKLSSSA
jgi:hypothetical protein